MVDEPKLRNEQLALCLTLRSRRSKSDDARRKPNDLRPRRIRSEAGHPVHPRSTPSLERLGSLL